MFPPKTSVVLSMILVFAAPWRSTSAQTASVQAPPVQMAANRYQQKLQPVLEKLIHEQQVPGFAISVVEDNRVVYTAAFGVKNVTRSDDPITTRSLFHMASITKTFVATSIMQLVEAGKIDLDAPVVKYLPYFRMADERYKIITVRQMVTHTSGMPDEDDYEWNKPQYDVDALERYVRSLGNLKLEFAPGERFRYSNMAFEVLGDVIAKVSGESFEDYVQRHILSPLGMKDSTLLVKQADPKLLAWGHELGETGDPFPSRVYPYNRIHSPSSDLHSNVLDMARWAIANMNRGELDGARILKSSTYEVMWKSAGKFNGKASPVGISWFLDNYKGNKVISHTGADPGFLAGLAMLPDKKIAVVWMANADWIPNADGVTEAALDVALGRKPKPIEGKRSIARAMFSTYSNSGIEAAIKQYETVKKLRPDAYNFRPGQLNALGHYLLRSGHTKDAIRIFQLNVAAYPASADALDALGEAYEKDGDKALAISNYEKALQFHRKQAHAAAALKRLKD
jgi:CubicO group peptidase (beta-lactamase class C family)